MIGDIIMYLKLKWKQLFCIHNYKPDRIGIITNLNNKRICSKCGKYENN